MSWVNTRKHRNNNAFTIVELLIVIVVIAILAAITVISYMGIQQKAQFSKMQADLSSLNRAILMYYTDNGHYPITPKTEVEASCSSGNWCGWNRATGDGFIPGLAPKYISSTPQFTGDDSTGTYLYRSPDGVDYKLIRLTENPNGLPALERTGSTYSPHWTDRWGYWSSDASRDW